MDTDLLTRSLRDAAEEVSAPPDLALRSARGGRRRIRRSRLLGAALSVVVILIGVIVATPRFGLVDWASDPRLAQPADDATNHLAPLDPRRLGRDYTRNYPEIDNRIRWPLGAMSVGEPRPVDVGHPGKMVTALQQAELLDDTGDPSYLGLWSVVAGLSDGSTVVVSEVQEGSRPSRAYGVLYGADGEIAGAFFGNDIDPIAMLPVRVRLPNGLGWIVADRGSMLQYRTAVGSPWQPAGVDAALLPANAIAVEVRRSGVTPMIVDLTG